jgi:hypothetical protein
MHPRSKVADRMIRALSREIFRSVARYQPVECARLSAHGGARRTCNKMLDKTSRVLIATLITLISTASAQADALYTITDLGAFQTSLGYPPSGYVPQLGTNTEGQGYVLDTSGQNAYLFQRTSIDNPTGAGLSQNLTASLEPLYYGATEPRVINQYTENSQGWILGMAGGGGPYGGFYFLFKPGDANPIGVGSDSINDINSSNVIVGNFTKIYTLLDNGTRYYGVLTGQPYQLEYHAALFSLGSANTNSVTDLNTLIPSGSGWNLTNALKFDDQGQIVGVGTLDGSPHAYLLTPGSAPTLVTAPEPSPLALIALMAVMLGLRRRLRCD